jgi:hypothetical protein
MNLSDFNNKTGKPGGISQGMGKKLNEDEEEVLLLCKPRVQSSALRTAARIT